MMSLNTKISPDKENLASLNATHNWIPGAEDVRPTPEELQRKAYHMAYIKQTFTSEADFVLKMTLGLPSKRVKGLHLVDRTNLPEKKAFTENMFPYQTQGKHYIMWYTYTPPDEQVTQDVKDAITGLVGHERFSFVWYINPKMTIPEVFHVQVFWKEDS